MVQTVKLENGEVHEFPDDATPQQMNEALHTMQAQSDNDAVKKAIINKFNYATGNNRTALDTIRDLGAGVITGLGKGAQFVSELQEKIPGYPALQNKVQNLTGIRAPRVDFNQIEDSLGSPNQSVGGQIAKGVGSYLPYGAAGGASLVGQILAGGAAGLANTGDQESNLFGLLPSGKTGGAIEGALLNALTHGAFEVFQALRPSRMFRGNLSPEQLQHNVDITQGSQTGLGDVIGSPFLKKRLENTLTNIPFSGANDALQKTGDIVVQRGNDLLKQMLGNNDPSNIPKTIADELNNQFEIHQTNKNDLYTQANKLADDANLKLDLPNFSKKAKDYSDAIETTNMLKYEPDIQKIFNKLQNYKNPVQQTRVTGNIVDASGKPLIDETTTSYPTLQEANLLKGRLNHYAQVAAQTPDGDKRGLSKVFGDLASSLKADINSSIYKSGNEELKSAYKNAETNYAQNFSPFLDKDIYKYISGAKDPETIVTNFIKTSRASDLAGRVAKLATKLPPQSKSLLGYSYFSRALDNEGNLNPGILGTSIENLGKNQFKTLVPDQYMRKALKDYSKFQNMNKEAQLLMFNPKTVQRNSDAIIAALLGMTGHMLYGNMGAAAATAAPILAGRIATKALTSPTVRESLVKAMIKNKDWNPNALKGIQAGVQGLVNR